MPIAAFALSLGATRIGDCAEARSLPNVVYILADDIGYGDFGCCGATKVKTPNVDRLASEGLLIEPGRTTVPSLLKRAGYMTGIVGKWHLGLGTRPTDYNGEMKPGPLEGGFDYAWILPATGDRVPCVWGANHRVVNLDPADPIKLDYSVKRGEARSFIHGIPRIGEQTGGKAALCDDENISTVIAAKSCAFLAQHKDERFFLEVATHDIHVPRAPNPKFRGKSQAKGGRRASGREGREPRPAAVGRPTLQPCRRFERDQEPRRRASAVGSGNGRHAQRTEAKRTQPSLKVIAANRLITALRMIVALKCPRGNPGSRLANWMLSRPSVNMKQSLPDRSLFEQQPNFKQLIEHSREEFV